MIIIIRHVKAHIKHLIYDVKIKCRQQYLHDLNQYIYH
jgi:hypothetical protein